MKATELLAAGRLLGNIYADLAAPICKKHGINQTCFDLIMFCATIPSATPLGTPASCAA